MKLFLPILLFLYSFAIFGSEEEFKGQYHSFEDVSLQESPNTIYTFQDVFKSIFVAVANHEQYIKNLILQESKTLKKKQILKLIELERRIIAIEKVQKFFIQRNSNLDMLTREFLQQQYIEYEKEQYIACCCGNIMQVAASAVGKFKNCLPDGFITEPVTLSNDTLFSLRFCARLNTEKNLRHIKHVDVCKEIFRTIDPNHYMLQLGNDDDLKNFADTKFKEYLKCGF